MKLLIFQIFTLSFGAGMVTKPQGVVLDWIPSGVAKKDTDWSVNYRGYTQYTKTSGDPHKIRCFPYHLYKEEIITEVLNIVIIEDEITRYEIDYFLAETCDKDILKATMKAVNNNNNDFKLIFKDNKGDCHTREYKIDVQELVSWIERKDVVDILCSEELASGISGDGIVKSWGSSGIWFQNDYVNDEQLIYLSFANEAGRIYYRNHPLSASRKLSEGNNIMVVDIYLDQVFLERLKVTKSTEDTLKSSIKMKSHTFSNEEGASTFIYMESDGLCYERQYSVKIIMREESNTVDQTIVDRKDPVEVDCPEDMTKPMESSTLWGLGSQVFNELKSELSLHKQNPSK